MGAVGASVLVWVVGEVVAVAVVVVDVVPVAAGCVVVGVPLAEEVGAALTGCCDRRRADVWRRR